MPRLARWCLTAGHVDMQTRRGWEASHVLLVRSRPVAPLGPRLLLRSWTRLTGTGHHPASRTRAPPGAAGAPATRGHTSKTRGRTCHIRRELRNCATQKHVSPERITRPVSYASQVGATSATARRRSRHRSPGVVPPRSRRVALCAAPRTGIASRPRAGKPNFHWYFHMRRCPGVKGAPSP